MKKSMIELANDTLTQENRPMTFLELWKIVAKEMGYTPSQEEANIAQFFSDLSLDGRFVALPKNTWDLRKRHSLANTIVDTDSLSVEDEDEFEEEEELDSPLDESSDDE